MKRLFAIIGTVPLVVLAACGDDDDNASAPVPSATTEAASGSTAAGGASATVKIVDVSGMGKVLATSDGMVLYFNDQDTADGSVLCDKTCADEWPPLTVTGTPMGDGVSDLATADRPDGSKQVTYEGHRLYTFKDDSAPMTAHGDGAADDFDGQHFTWHAATTDQAAGTGGAATTPGGTQASSAPTTAGY